MSGSKGARRFEIPTEHSTGSRALEGNNRRAACAWAERRRRMRESWRPRRECPYRARAVVIRGKRERNGVGRCVRGKARKGINLGKESVMWTETQLGGLRRPGGCCCFGAVTLRLACSHRTRVRRPSGAAVLARRALDKLLHSAHGARSFAIRRLLLWYARRSPAMALLNYNESKRLRMTGPKGLSLHPMMASRCCSFAHYSPKVVRLVICYHRAGLRPSALEPVRRRGYDCCCTLCHLARLRLRDSSQSDCSHCGYNHLAHIDDAIRSLLC